MILRPDEYGHNNPKLAIADAGNVRGGPRQVTGRAALYELIATFPDKLKEHVTRVRILADEDNKGLATTVLLVNLAQADTAAGWEVEAAGGGEGGDTITGLGFAEDNIFTVTTDKGLKTVDLSRLAVRGDVIQSIALVGTVLRITTDMAVLDVDLNSLRTSTDQPAQAGDTVADLRLLTGNILRLTTDQGVFNVDLSAYAGKGDTISAFTLVGDKLRLTTDLGEREVDLSTYATKAYVNAAVSVAKQRSVHEGTQLAATISDLRETVQDIVAGFLGAGSNVALSYDDEANTFTIAAAGPGQFDPEATRDAIGAALIGVGNISVVINDAADTITISTTATVNQTDQYLLNRDHHEGTQDVSTIRGLGKAATTNKYSDLDDLPPAVPAQPDARFTEDIAVSLAGGKTFGRYANGQLIPAKNKTAAEVILLAAIEDIYPTYQTASISFQQSQPADGEVGESLINRLTSIFSAGDAGAPTQQRLYRDGVQVPNGSAAQNPFSQNVSMVRQLTPSGLWAVADYQAGAPKLITPGNRPDDRTPQVRSTQAPQAAETGFSSSILYYTGYYRVFFGPATAEPTTSAQVRALPQSQLTKAGNQGTLITGTTATIFIIVLPPGQRLLMVQDQDNQSANITAQYALVGQRSVQDAGTTYHSGYSVYMLRAATPYPSSARHLFTYGT